MVAVRLGMVLVALGSTLTAGCVDRRFLVETNIPGAQITVDGKPIGPSPADARWEYAGMYEFTAVAPGYQLLTQKVRFTPMWYEIPPMDFFAEVLFPFRIEDRRVVRLTLVPFKPINQLDLISSADGLRSKAGRLPPSTIPDEPEPLPVTPKATPASAPTPLPVNIMPGLGRN